MEVRGQVIGSSAIRGATPPKVTAKQQGARSRLRRATAQVNMRVLMPNRMGSLWSGVLFFAVILLCGVGMSARAAGIPTIFPLSQVRPGMQGVAYTIFTGDQIQQINVTVLGVLKDAMGPKQDVILVQLSGADVAKTGVVAGMSGSPVYFDGKLAGAISLKIGNFTKDAIAGVTPIQNMLDIQNAMTAPIHVSRSGARAPVSAGATAETQDWPQKVALGGNQFLVPIETPLVFSGVMPEALARFSPDFEAYGMSAAIGGTVPPSPEDAKLQPGDMVGMQLASGDLSMYAGCTVTAIIHGRVFVCGHPILGLGSVKMPMTRAYVVTTLASSLESTKIMNTGGTIGTFQQDRLTGVVGQLGPGPAMLPVSVNVDAGSQQKHFHFNVVENRKLTPLLVALAAYNGVVGNTAYNHGSTLQLSGKIAIAGHPSVKLRDMFVPTNPLMPAGMELALDVETAFARIYMNPYEQPKVQNVIVNVTAMPESRWSEIDGAWTDRSEVRAGQTVKIKVLLRPYRGTSYIKEVPITIPAQAPHGKLQILVSDAASLNRMQEMFGGQGQQLQNLDQLIGMINRQRQNDRLYVTLLENAPTLLVEDKELPNVPASEINVLDQQHMPGGPQLLYQSVIARHSIPMNQVVLRQQYISVTVK